MRHMAMCLLALVLLALSVGQASAREAVRIWQNLASAGTIETELAQAGVLVGDTISVLTLGRQAYAFATERGYLVLVPSQYHNEEAYARLFQRWNNYDGREFISLAEFQRKGRTGGWWLPNIRDLPREEVSAQPVSVSTMGLQERIAMLEERIATSGSVATDELAKLRDELETQYAQLRMQIANDMAGLRDEVADVAGRVSGTEEGVAELRTSVVTLDTRVEALEGRGFLTWDSLLVWVEAPYLGSRVPLGLVGLGLVLLLSLLGAFGFFRAGRARRVATKAIRVAEEVKAETAELGGRVAVVEQAVGSVRFGLTNIAPQALAKLKQGAYVVLPVMWVADGREIFVEIVRLDDTRFELRGVQRSAGRNEWVICSAGGIASSISRAAQSGRLVGCPPPTRGAS